MLSKDSDGAACGGSMKRWAINLLAGFLESNLQVKLYIWPLQPTQHRAEDSVCTKWIVHVGRAGSGSGHMQELFLLLILQDSGLQRSQLFIIQKIPSPVGAVRGERNK